MIKLWRTIFTEKSKPSSLTSTINRDIVYLIDHFVITLFSKGRFFVIIKQHCRPFSGFTCNKNPILNQNSVKIISKSFHSSLKSLLVYPRDLALYFLPKQGCQYKSNTHPSAEARFYVMISCTGRKPTVFEATVLLLSCKSGIVVNKNKLVCWPALKMIFVPPFIGAWIIWQLLVQIEFRLESLYRHMKIGYFFLQGNR